MTGKNTSTLHFAVRPGVICKYTGQLLLIFSILNAVPLLFCLVIGELHLAWPYTAITLGTGFFGFLMQRIKTSADIQNNETLVISALIFIIIPLLVALPFLQHGLTYTDAFFEAVSGVTTTGLSNLSSVEPLPRTFLFARAWLQWIGGLGIVVLGAAILLPQSKATLHLFKDNWEKEGLIASTKSYARVILKVYLLMTSAGFILLMALGVPWFDATTHVLAAVSTGGFSTYDNSLSGVGGRAVQSAVILISCLGAFPLMIYYISFKGDGKKFTANQEIRGLAVASVFAVAATTMILMAADGLSADQAFIDGPLLALSAQSTTGFSTIPVPGLSEAAKFILILFMLIGGNVGSTAGGIKILRLIVILKMIKLLIIRSGLAPNAVVRPRLMGKRLESVEIETCFLVVFLFIIVILLSWLPFILMGYPFLDSLFEVVSATCTVGLSTGISSSSLPTVLKSILCLDMLMGRLEIVAFLIFFYPPTWLGQKRGV
ncbi:MAG: TrkH family potassium uptake protein [Desulfobulbaceae bacterium]|nr:TrkH family potassium uptake protein [Desulfobulbaceae bacterium]